MEYKIAYSIISKYTPSLEYKVTFADIPVKYGSLGVGPCKYDSGAPGYDFGSSNSKKGWYEPD